jgi:hypothetical protein
VGLQDGMLSHGQSWSGSEQGHMEGAYERVLRIAKVSFVTYVRLSAWSTSIPTGNIFVKYDIWVLFETLLTNSVSLKSDTANWYFLHWDVRLWQYLADSQNEKCFRQKL